MPDAVNLNLDRYSYSKISTYKQCKFKFKIKYLDKNFIFNASIATDFGSLVHATEEDIAKALQKGEPVNYIALKNTFILKARQLALTYPEEFFKKDKSDRTYQEKVYQYLDFGIYRLENFMLQNPNLKIIGIEEKFEFNYDDIHSFNGSIDRAFLNTETNEILIQDIKTWPVEAQASELKAPLQFAVYSMAAEQLWNTPITKIKCEYDLPFCNTTQAATSDNLVEEGKKVLNKLFKGIQNNEFKPTISALCHWCEYNPLSNPDILNSKPEAICPYFSTWQKSGDPVQNTLIRWQDLSTVDVDRQFCISQLRQQTITN
jgi:RecB family exonuclease